MLFVSPVFLIYFLPIVLFLYHLSRQRFKNYVVLTASLIFYAWGSPTFVFVLLTTTLIDFLLVKKMDSIIQPGRRKIFLIISLVLNIGLLVYFKYMNFFVNSFNHVIESIGGPHLHALNILLPIGISFFVFESITYVVDVYKKEQKALDNFSHYLLYIFFFPKMIAGPIVRFAEISEQIQGRLKETDASLFVQGFGRFVTGLAKKIMIADVLAVYTNAYVLNIDGEYGSITAWIAAIAFAMQIYFDFSGYSDMALGLAGMLGFKLAENFNNPFHASGLNEFWKRWHMSFTRWVKQYLYIPLGGNKVSKVKQYFNLWIIFIISGLWHGAAWNYVIWGCLHGLVMTFEKILNHYNIRWPSRWIAIPFTTLLVVLITLLLKSNNLQDSIQWYRSLFSFTGGNNQLPMLMETKLMLLIAIVFSFIGLSGAGKRLEQWWYGNSLNQSTAIKPVLWIVLWILSLSYITGHSFTAFIYFMF